MTEIERDIERERESEKRWKTHKVRQAKRREEKD